MEIIPTKYLDSIRKEPLLSGSFSIRDIRELLSDKPMVQELHRHDFFFLLALKKGAGVHEIDFTSYEVDDHTLFFMRPGQVHHLTLQKESSGFLMQFKTDFHHPNDPSSKQLLRKASGCNYHRLDADQYEKLDVLLNSIYQEYSHRKEYHLETIKANLSIFYVELIRLCGEGVINPPNSYEQERLEEFLRLLETHISSHKQVSFYAQMLNLSAFQLNAITKNLLGKTSSKLITEQLVLESKRYLLATSNQVKEIAFHLGYDDVSYFIRFFKKHSGFSPEAFRNNFR